MLNGAGTINPMVILLTTLAFIQWETRGSSLPAAELAQEIFIFSLVLCGIFIVIALRLNVLVGHSILRPIGAMLGVVGRVKDGNFTQRIGVTSNDELGVLGDAGNDMIRGLADRERKKGGHPALFRSARLYFLRGGERSRGGDPEHEGIFHRHARGHSKAPGPGAAICGG
ncbi:MAG: HAMP domain-containing protein [Deltaproteobacteria bacterium]|nr:HAMP domain-containing protein [Deltaproteobacteria bacterium]